MNSNELEGKSKEELIKIIKSLKAKNESLTDAVVSLKVELGKVGKDQSGSPPPPRKKKKSGKNEKIFEKRKIAIKFSYDGTKFNGLQRSPLPNSPGIVIMIT